ncbi:MAG: LacI family DNA-binding transcriptional regulator [Psychroflexus sp.]
MITLKELAKQLNVSVSTVSKALHDAKDIGPDTKKRIKEAAELYNYKPNRTALALKANKTLTIGVIIPDVLNQFFAKVLHGIEKYATTHHYDTIVCVSHDQMSKEAKSVDLLTQGRVDGFIISLALETLQKKDFSHIESIQQNKKKLVLFDRTTEKISCDKVIINDEKSIFDATKVLIDKGKRQIAFVSNIEDLGIGQLRKEGYRNALKTNNIEIDSKLEIDLTNQTHPHEIIVNFLKNNTIDAVISADNTSGLMFQSIVNSEMPKESSKISIIGFSDEKTAQLSYPPMSYIDQNAMKIGEKSAELLINKLEAKTQSDIRFEMPFDINLRT